MFELWKTVPFNFVHLITQLLQFNDAWLKLSEAIDSLVKTDNYTTPWNAKTADINLIQDISLAVSTK